MGWDAYLYTEGNPHAVCDVNYTFNVTEAVQEAFLRSIKDLIPKDYECFDLYYRELGGLTGYEASEMLTSLIDELKATPIYYTLRMKRAYDAQWGSYPTIVNYLIQMRDASKEYPNAVWTVSW